VPGLNVTIVDADVAYPPTSGKRLRTLNLMLRLAGRHRITYIVRADARSPEARSAVDYLTAHGIEPILVDHPVPPKRGVGFYARLAANVLSPLPYSVSSHQSEPVRQALCEHAARRQVDLWQYEWAPYLPMRPVSPAPLVVVAHNVESLIWQRYAETETNPLRRWYVQQQWRKFERFEGRAFCWATRVVAVSPEDAALVRDRFGVDSVDVVDNGIDRAYYDQTPRSPTPNRILFLGSLEWRPNLDGVRLLLDQVFPAVRALEPRAELVLVGRNPPAWLREKVQEVPGVQLHANVADVRPFLGSSAVMAVPLRVGGGSRLKILEALACGLPVVSTRVGAEGLCLRAGVDFTQVEGIEDMASALLTCLRQPGAARQMAERGRQVVRERYDWGGLADRLEVVWEKCVTGNARAEANVFYA
jgi:glycosyltransferase involved in cell wall biosynthesis